MDNDTLITKGQMCTLITSEIDLYRAELRDLRERGNAKGIDDCNCKIAALVLLLIRLEAEYPSMT